MANNALKTLRVKNKLTQKEVAAKLNIKDNAYSKIERGERQLSLDQIKNLAEIFNIDIETLEAMYFGRTQAKEGSFDLFQEIDGLDICYSKFEGSKHIDSYKELFEGFSNIRIITFSSSVSFIAKVIKECSFKNMEIIFGNKKVFDSAEYLKELVMETNAIINVLTGNEPEFVNYVKEKLANKELSIYIANPNALSHEKIYVLWNDGDDNRVRVITGSANMSLKAYSGRQKENIIVYDNDDAAFDYFYNRFDSFLKDTISEVKPENLKKITAENMLEDNLAFNTVIQTNNSIYVDTSVPEDAEDFDGYYIENVENNRALLKHYTDSVNSGVFNKDATDKNLLILEPSRCRNVLDAYKLSLHKYKQQAMYYPEFFVDTDLKGYFNCEAYNTEYTEENVRKDIQIFKDFFNGYHNGSFIGKLNESLELAVEKYYASVVFGFVSPVIHYCIKLSGNGINSYSFPSYLILRGPKSAGKTPFCSFLLKLMFNQYKLNFDEMSGIMRKSENVSAKEGLVPAMLSGKGFPVVIDELTRGRAKDYEGIIKNPEVFKNPCSCVIFTCNDDFEISDYIVKRSVLFNFDISNDGSSNLKVNSAISNLNNLTGDLYKCFFTMFTERFEELLIELNNIRHSNHNEDRDIPDIFKLGSEVLKEIFETYSTLEDCKYVKIYDSSFYRDGKSNLDERKKKFINDFEFGDWNIDPAHNLLYKVFDGMDGRSKAREFADAMNQYGFITATGNKVRIKLDWATEFFDYDFVANSNEVIAPERIVEKRVEVIKEVAAEKPKGILNKLAYLFSDD